MSSTTIKFRNGSKLKLDDKTTDWKDYVDCTAIKVEHSKDNNYYNTSVALAIIAIILTIMILGLVTGYIPMP